MATEWQANTGDSGSIGNINSSPLRSSSSTAVCQSCVGPGVGSTTSPEVSKPLTSQTDKGRITSSRFPSQKRASSLKRLCVRALSSEHAEPGQPLMISEPGLGTAIVVMFELDSHREYMVAYLGDEENDTVKDWPLIAPQLQAVAKTVTKAYEAAEAREQDDFTNPDSGSEAAPASSVTSSGSVPGLPSSESSYGSWISGVSAPSRTFRKPSREAQSLHKLVDDPTIFTTIHNRFVKLLLLL